MKAHQKPKIGNLKSIKNCSNVCGSMVKLGKSNTYLYFNCLQFDEVADKDDLMGVEDTAKRGITSYTSTLYVYHYVIYHGR